MGTKVIELNKIVRRFGPRFMLEDISIDLRSGEVHFITGENGSGKTVLMQVIAGFHRADSGQIILEGQSVAFDSLREARKAGIVYQQQDIELFDNLSIAENVYFAEQESWRFFSVPPLRLAERCKALFDRFGIDLLPETPVAELGYAQKLLVAACASFVAPGKVVIFDEPTAGMGESEREIFFLMIRALQERGSGVFYISHRLEEIPRIGTRLTVLQQGKVTGHLDSVRADRSTIIRMMIGKNCPERYPRIPTKPGPIIFSVNHLKKDPALKDVSFSLRRGEILGLMGIMGSGRSKLASCLCGDEEPEAGSLHFGGRPVSFKHPAEALLQGIALIPEDRVRNAVFARQDIFSNLVAASLSRFNTPLGLDLPYMEELSQEYVKSFAINPARVRGLMDHCSGGNQQKVVISRWLMSCAKVFIMDEPTRGIDAAARVDIYNTMNDLVSNGAAILFISSDIEELLGMCDRILVLAKGVIVSEHDRFTATKEVLLDASSPL